MRRAIVLLYAMVGFLCLLNSCKDLGAPAGKTEIYGTYAYKAFDLNGVQVASGTLVLRGSDSLLSAELRIGEEVTIFEGRVLESRKIELYATPTVLFGAEG
jgi:hypothetical protein